MVILSMSVAALAATDAAKAPDPLAWATSHWTQLTAAVAAFFALHYVRRIDKKFDVIFEWKKGIDRRMGVHDQVWEHGDGCGPFWVHHRSDGASAIHFRSTDHDDLCDRCQALQGRVVMP